MLLNKYLLILTTIISLSQKSFSENQPSYCWITNANEVSSNKHYQFKNVVLECSTNVTLINNKEKVYLKNELSIVRGHKNELDSLTLLASSHGYHLTNQKINCDQLHCDHFEVIELDQFENINEYKVDKLNTKGAMLIQSVVDEVNPIFWLEDIITLSGWSRRTGTNDNNSAATWIQGQLNDLNLNVSLQGFSVSGQFTTNIIGVQTGVTKPDDWYIVGAHMDSIPSFGSAPGAVDNASGCAAVLEMARIASNYSFASSIFFICFSGEEQGLKGSIYHSDSILLNGDQPKVKAVLTMDMIGYTSNSDNELLLETSLSNQWLMDVLAQNATSYAPNLTVYTSTNPFGSDHVPYLNNNMPAILSIDDDWNVYPDYHQSTDLPENINLTQGNYILKTNMASLAQLAEVLSNNDFIFKNSFESDSK